MVSEKYSLGLVNLELDQMEKMMASIHQVLLKLEVEEVDLDVVVEGDVLVMKP